MKIIKIIIFYIIVFGVLFGERKYRVLQLHMEPGVAGILLILLLVISYLVLLGLELKAKVSRKSTYKKIKKAAFFFSFWIGICFALLIPFMDGGYIKFYGVTDALIFALGCAIFGALGGGIGILLMPFYMKHVFGEDRNEWIE